MSDPGSSLARDGPRGDQAGAGPHRPGRFRPRRAGALDAALERAREQVEALAATAAELESTLPGRVGDALQDGLREQVLPVGRNLAEIRGL